MFALQQSASTKKQKLQTTLTRMGTIAGRKQLTAAQISTAEAARWYVYSQQQLAKRGFSDPHYKAMMRAEFNAGFSAGAGTHSGRTPSTQPLICEALLLSWVRAEFSVFKLFL